MTEVLSNPWHETRDIQEIYPEFLDVGQRKEMTQGMAVEPFRGKSIGAVGIAFADMELLDQGKQTEFVHGPEWFGPQKFRIRAQGMGLDDEGVVELRNSGNVPGITGEGACEETPRVVD